jgi:hypothetical protein
MTRNPRAHPSFCVAIEDLYDLGGDAPVCAAQHLRVNFPILARRAAKAGDD